MFFSRRKMNFDPYVTKREDEVSDEGQEQSTPVEEETEITSVPEVAVGTVAAQQTQTYVTEEPVAAPVQDMPALVRPVQPVVETEIVEDTTSFVAPNLDALFVEGYQETAKASYADENANEENVPEVQAAPAIEENEEYPKAQEEVPAMVEPQNVEDKYAKEREQMEYEVIIGKNTSFKGEINIDGTTRIDGRVEGTVCVNNDLFVGETGHIEGEIKVINATISGTIVGNIKCSSRLELLSTSSISGDIECGALIVAEGASINATVACGKAVAKNEPAPAAEPVVE